MNLESLGPALSGIPALIQRKWESWRGKQRLEQSTLVNFAELLRACVAFAEPVLSGGVAH
jgi:hypothetical protein